MAVRKKGKHNRWADQKADRRKAKQKKRQNSVINGKVIKWAKY